MTTHISLKCRLYGRAEHQPCSGTCDGPHGPGGGWCGEDCSCWCHAGAPLAPRPGELTPSPGRLPAWTAACPAAAALAAQILATRDTERLLAIQALKHHIREEAMADAEALHHV